MADPATLVTREDIVALFDEIVDGLNRELAQFERIKKIRLLPRELSMAAGELTPTLKVRRKLSRRTGAKLIDEMYHSSD